MLSASQLKRLVAVAVMEGINEAVHEEDEQSDEDEVHEQGEESDEGEEESDEDESEEGEDDSDEAVDESYKGEEESDEEQTRTQTQTYGTSTIKALGHSTVSGNNMVGRQKNVYNSTPSAPDVHHHVTTVRRPAPKRQANPHFGPAPKRQKEMASRASRQKKSTTPRLKSKTNSLNCRSETTKVDGVKTITTTEMQLMTKENYY